MECRVVADENDNGLEQTVFDDGQKRLSRKKLVLFVIVPLLVVLGGGAVLHSSGMLDGFLPKKPASEQQPAVSADGQDHVDHGGPGHYYDLPDIIVNLSDSGSRQRFLKLSISLELPRVEDEAGIQAIMPRISDQFQTYLRELRVDDLRGSAGVYRLRQELLGRVRQAAKPVIVRDVLFREILVQ